MTPEQNPTPWKPCGNVGIVDAKDNYVADMLRPVRDRTIRCVNTHDALVKACKRGVDLLECAVVTAGGDPATHGACCQMRDALVKAKN